MDEPQRAAIDRLSGEEKTWPDLSSQASRLVSPDWHGKILAEREAAIERGEEGFEDWDVVKALLRKQIEK